MHSKQRLMSHRPLPALGLIVLAALWCLVPPASSQAGELDFPETDYTLRSNDGAQIIGNAHFGGVTDGNGLTTLRGEYNYLDGEHDVDESTLRPGVAGKPPTLVRQHHLFFFANGSRNRESSVDIAAGRGSCTIYTDGKPQRSTEKFTFPSNTYAGDAVMLPLRRFVAEGGKGTTSFYAFNCIPGPKLLKVTVTASPPAPWEYFPGPDLSKVDVKPDFGWINVVIAPFLPEIRAWFQSRPDYFFMGCSTSRYYKGLKYLMVRARPGDAQVKAQPAAKSSP